MALANVDDVKRILRVSGTDATRDARIRAALAAVEAWARRSLPRFDATGTQVTAYFDVYEDAALRLPSPDATVTLVKVYEHPSSSGSELSPIELGLGTGYDVTDDGQLLLRPSLEVSPFEGAVATRTLRLYSRVEVFYEATGSVPVDVTEGVAFLAAGYYTDGPRALRGITSERIGDYSYTVGEGGGGDDTPRYLAQAQFFLQDYMRRAQVVVT